MLVGLFSDAHCNAEAVRTAIEQLIPIVDEVLCLGDSVYEYRMSNETVEAIRDSGVRSIVGNHEMELLGPGGQRAHGAAGVREDLLDYLRGLPTTVDVAIGDKTLRMTHGSPFPPFNDYVVKGTKALSRCAELDVDFLVLGHTHIPMVERVGGTLVVNPGSVGESREHGAKNLVSYAILDTDAESAEIVRFPNPRFV